MFLMVRRKNNKADTVLVSVGMRLNSHGLEVLNLKMDRKTSNV